MTSSTPVPPDQPPAPKGAIQFVATDRTSRDLGLAVLKYRWTRPITWVSNAVIVVVLLIYGVVSDQPWFAALLIIIVFPLVTGLQYLTTGRQLKRLYGPGSRHWVLWGERSVTMGGPMGASETPYPSLEQVWTTTGAAVLRFRSLRSVALLPAALLPPAEESRLRERLRQQQ